MVDLTIPGYRLVRLIPMDGDGAGWLTSPFFAWSDGLTLMVGGGGGQDD